MTFAQPQTSNEQARHHKVQGTWWGTLDVFGLELMVVFKISRDSAGTLAASIDSPDQGARDVHAEKVTFQDGSLHLEAEGIPSVFEGKIEEDGSTIEGKWKQSGFAFALVVRRVSQAELLKLLEEKSYAKVFGSDELKEDLDFLFKTIKQVHPNMYAYTTEQEFSKLREQLYQRITKPMSRLEFYKAVAPIVASLKSGHTFVQRPLGLFNEYLEKGGKIFPVELQWDGADVILKGYSGSEDIPTGGKLLTIDGKNARDLLTRAARYLPAENKACNLASLESPDTLSMFLWIEKGAAEFMKITIKSMDGVVEEHTIKSLSQEEIESHSRSSAVQDTTASSDEKRYYSYSYISDSDVGRIQFDLCTDLERFKVFLAETFRKLGEQNVGNLIIDIRENPGGQSSLGDEFLEYLTDKAFRQFEKIELKVSQQVCELYKSAGNEQPAGPIGSIRSFESEFEQPGDNPLRYEGNVFLLIGPKTTSSAMSFAAAVKHFEIGTVMGQETGGPLVCYGECVYASLPNTGLAFSVACKRFVQACGKPDGRGVIPDYEVKQTPEDTAKGVDTVLEFTLELIKTGAWEKGLEKEQAVN
jgi:C-terminal processing protease CtpA/Prc